MIRFAFAMMLLCTPPNPLAPVPAGGLHFGDVIDYSTTPPTHSVGWLCQDYSIHWTEGEIANHYVCTEKDTCPGRRRAAAHVRMEKD